jgi:hypothetical protein
MGTIQPGDRVFARAATDEWVRRRAITGVVDGYDFPVVWVCTEDEWARYQSEGREPDRIPWPAEEVRVDTQEELGAGAR